MAYAPADAMRHEYGAVVAAGFPLQLDCPSFALTLEQGYELAGSLAQAQGVLNQCEEAGLLSSEGAARSASASGSAGASVSASPFGRRGLLTRKIAMG